MNLVASLAKRIIDLSIPGLKWEFIKENKKVIKERKHAINQESDQEVKKKTITTKKKVGNGKRKLELNT